MKQQIYSVLSKISKKPPQGSHYLCLGDSQRKYIIPVRAQGCKYSCLYDFQEIPLLLGKQCVNCGNILKLQNFCCDQIMMAVSKQYPGIKSMVLQVQGPLIKFTDLAQSIIKKNLVLYSQMMQVMPKVGQKNMNLQVIFSKAPALEFPSLELDLQRLEWCRFFKDDKFVEGLMVKVKGRMQFFKFVDPYGFILNFHRNSHFIYAQHGIFVILDSQQNYFYYADISKACNYNLSLNFIKKGQFPPTEGYMAAFDSVSQTLVVAGGYRLNALKNYEMNNQIYTISFQNGQPDQEGLKLYEKKVLPNKVCMGRLFITDNYFGLVGGVYERITSCDSIYLLEGSNVLQALQDSSWVQIKISDPSVSSCYPTVLPLKGRNEIILVAGTKPTNMFFIQKTSDKIRQLKREEPVRIDLQEKKAYRVKLFTQDKDLKQLGANLLDNHQNIQIQENQPAVLARNSFYAYNIQKSSAPAFMLQFKYLGDNELQVEAIRLVK